MGTRRLLTFVIKLVKSGESPQISFGQLLCCLHRLVVIGIVIWNLPLRIF